MVTAHFELTAFGTFRFYVNQVILVEPLHLVMSIRPLLRQELPWLVAELVLLLVLMNANAPELWFRLVVFLVVIFYRVERWWSSRPN